MGWDSCDQMTNRQPVVLWTWSKISKTWCWILPENGKEEKNCLKMAFCKTLSNTKMADFDARSQLVWLLRPWSTKSRPYLPWRHTAKLGTYEPAGNQISCHLACHQTLECLQMNVLWGEALGLDLPDTTYYEEDNERLSCLASNGWKTHKIDFCRGRNQRYPR